MLVKFRDYCGANRIIECREVRFVRVFDPVQGEYARLTFVLDDPVVDSPRELTGVLVQSGTAVEVLPDRAHTLFSWGRSD